jgi:hypothetical protein
MSKVERFEDLEVWKIARTIFLPIPGAPVQN